MTKTALSIEKLTHDVCAVSDVYAERFGIERDAGWYLTKLTEELGELASVDLKLRGQGRTGDATEEELRTSLADEAGDLLAHLLLFCADRNIDLATALKNKWFKYMVSAD